MAEEGQTARCVNCRADVLVPESYAHGDHIKCGTCNTQHKVSRGEVLRLVLADVTPLKDELRANQQRIAALESELQIARGSFGIGANGLGVAVAFVAYQVGIKEQLLSAHMAWDAAGVALGSGLVLELANYLFLAKRQAMTRLAADIDQLRDEGRQVQQKIRDALRP